MAAPRSRGCSPPARWPAPACTGPTASRATRSSRGSSSAHVPRTRWVHLQRPCGCRPLRSRRRLEPALCDTSTRTTWEEASVALVAWLVTRAALRREESRGGHRRADFPARDDLHWQLHVADRRVPLKDIDEQ